MKSFSREEEKRRAFLRVASVMRGMWEEKGSSDTRLLLPPLIPDEFVVHGRSRSGGSVREHVIPRRVICNQCHEMLEAGATDDQIATYIQQRLFIVYVSEEERDRLDKGSNLNLRQRMPEGWCPNSGHPMERLRSAGIEWDEIV